MLEFYLNTTSPQWFGLDGNPFRDNNPSMAFLSRDTVKIIACTETPEAGEENVDPTSWPRDVSWAAIPGIGAKITVDNDYIHKLKGTLATEVSAGSTASISATIENASYATVPASGTVRLFDASGNYEAIAYTARNISGNTVVFTTSGTLTGSYESGATMDCDQSPYCEAYLDTAQSNLEQGEFVFQLVVDSSRLREEMDYTNTARLDVQGLEMLVYKTVDGNDEPVKAYLCDTFSITGTIGNVGYEAEPPDPVKNQIAGIVNQLAAAGFEVEQQYDESGNTQFRFRSSSAGGTWSQWITVSKGEKGETGETGAAAGFGTPNVTVETLPAGSDATASVAASGDNTAKVFNFNFGIPKGADGKNGTDGKAGADGADGVSSYTYVAYASDASGAGFSLTPSNALKFRAEIHTTTAIETPDADDFAGATWVKYIGDDGAGAGDMTKAVYDTNDDGIVDHAATADTVGATTAAQVADAVGKAHTHANKATLDKLAEADGKLTYDGAEIGGGSGTVKSVNGQLPDESGNVTVETGGVVDESRLLKVPTSADEGKLPVIRADKIPAVYHDTTLAAIVIEDGKVIDKISGKELTKVGSPQIIDGGIHSPTNSDYYMLELEGVEGLPVAVSFDYQGDESPDSSNIVTINGNCAYYSMNGVSFCRSQGGGNNIKIDNQPVGVSEAYRNYVMQVSSDNYESKMPPVAFIAGESKSPTYEGSFPAMSPLSSVKVCGRFGKIRNILIGSAFPYTGNFTPRGDGVEGFGVPEKREPGWNYETLDEAANGRLLPANPANGDIPCFDATATIGGGNDETVKFLLQPATTDGELIDSAAGAVTPATITNHSLTVSESGEIEFSSSKYATVPASGILADVLRHDKTWVFDLLVYLDQTSSQSRFFGTESGGDFFCQWTGDYGFDFKYGDTWISTLTGNVGEWNLLTLEYYQKNGTWHVALYLQGVLCQDKEISTSFDPKTSELAIGRSTSGSYLCSGKIRAIRIREGALYNGQSFTPDEFPYQEPQTVGEWGKLNKAELVKSVNGQTPDSSGAVTLPEATASAAGLMAATDKTALATLEANYLNKHAGFSDADMNAAIELGAFWGTFVENAPTSTSSSVYYALQNSPYGVHSGIVQIACQVASNLLFYRYFDKQNASGTWRRLLTDADWYSQRVNSASDFNAYKTPGNYFFTLAAHLNSPYSPNTTSGWLVVEAVSNGEYIKQTHYAFNSRKTWIRTYDNNNSTWVAWHQQLSIADLTESKARPGYFKLPGGTIVQWGAASNITADGSTQITFPVAFPNAFLIGNATAVSGNASASGVVVSLTAVLSTGMTLLTKNHPGNGNDINVHWLAIGY